MTVDGREYLPHSGGCFVCGDENDGGLRTRFFVEGDTVRARLAVPKHLNGYRGVVHGGVLAALIDESMGWAATVFGRGDRMYVTGELTIKYIAPVPPGETVEIVSRLVDDAGRVAYGAGEALCGGKACVRATGKFLPMSREGTAGVAAYLKYDGCRKYRTLFREAGEAE